MTTTRSARLAVGIVALAAVAAAVAAILLVVRPFEPLSVMVIQDGLEHPWDIAFADDGRMLATERAGRVLVFASAEPDAELLQTVLIPDVRAELESGLMGIAVHGDSVFVCASRDPGGDGGEPWRVDLMRATLGAEELSEFETIPIGPTIGAPRHQGCAVVMDGDHLWFSIGEANQPGDANPAQDPAILNGKVLRLNLDGSVPDDNPFDNAVYSMGHRNPQGLAIRRDGLVLEVEHGTDVNDEINVIVPGGNYGYPCVTGDGEPGPIPTACDPATATLPPAWASGSPTLATSGATFLIGPEWGDWEGDLVVTTLKEEDLRRFSVAADGAVTPEETLLDGRYGRLRAAVIGPDGALYLSTSNGDDRILRVTRS